MLSINQEKPTKVTENAYIILQVFFYQTSVCSHYGTGGKIVQEPAQRRRIQKDRATSILLMFMEKCSTNPPF